MLDLEALDILVFPKILQDGKFTALMADYDKLIIDQHAIGLNYGRMVQYVLNEVVIKRLTGGKAHSLTEVAHLWLDCTALSQGILAQVATTFGGTQADIEGICNQAVDSVIAGAVGWIDRLSIDTPMYVSGSARLVDSNCDNMVEKITKGQTAGYVQGGASQVPITGDFECMRL